jgi:hypothetical protein
MIGNWQLIVLENIQIMKHLSFNSCLFKVNTILGYNYFFLKIVSDESSIRKTKTFAIGFW